MVEHKQSGVQKFFTGMASPGIAADMEAHSRMWMMQCPRCGFEKSIWDMGGIRYKATGNSRNFMRCVSCGKRSWHRMYKREGALPDVPSGKYAANSQSRWRTWALLLGVVTILSLLITWSVLSLLS